MSYYFIAPPTPYTPAAMTAPAATILTATESTGITNGLLKLQQAAQEAATSVNTAFRAEISSVTMGHSVFYTGRIYAGALAAAPLVCCAIGMEDPEAIVEMLRLRLKA